ncbi:hypothetical protein BJ742DRAFT_794087 [Cladochytrium replicatum]|nr:hypothetical protein BJ742DRAFT_794087 [Cladochytrium replicatum]
MANLIQPETTAGASKRVPAWLLLSTLLFSMVLASNAYTIGAARPTPISSIPWINEDQSISEALTLHGLFVSQSASEELENGKEVVVVHEISTIVVSHSKGIAGVDADTGKTVWSHDLANIQLVRRCDYDLLIVTGADFEHDLELRSFNIKTGELHWTSLVEHPGTTYANTVEIDFLPHRVTVNARKPDEIEEDGVVVLAFGLYAAMYGKSTGNTKWTWTSNLGHNIFTKLVSYPFTGEVYLIGFTGPNDIPGARFEMAIIALEAVMGVRQRTMFHRIDPIDDIVHDVVAIGGSTAVDDLLRAVDERGTDNIEKYKYFAWVDAVRELWVLPIETLEPLRIGEMAPELATMDIPAFDSIEPLGSPRDLYFFDYRKESNNEDDDDDDEEVRTILQPPSTKFPDARQSLIIRLTDNSADLLVQLGGANGDYKSAKVFEIPPPNVARRVEATYLQQSFQEDFATPFVTRVYVVSDFDKAILQFISLEDGSVLHETQLDLHSVVSDSEPTLDIQQGFVSLSLPSAPRSVTHHGPSPPGLRIGEVESLGHVDIQAHFVVARGAVNRRIVTFFQQVDPYAEIQTFMADGADVALMDGGDDDDDDEDEEGNQVDVIVEEYEEDIVVTDGPLHDEL